MSDHNTTPSNTSTKTHDTFSPIRVDLVDRLTRTCDHVANGLTKVKDTKPRIAA